MSRLRIHADDSEKKAAYRARLRERMGEDAYREIETEKRAAYMARLRGDTGESRDSPICILTLSRLCNLCVRARARMWEERVQYEFAPDEKIDWSLSGMLNEILLGLQKAKREAPGLKPELAALYTQCLEARWHKLDPVIGYDPYRRLTAAECLPFANAIADIEDRLCEMAGREKPLKPELDRLLSAKK